MFTDYVTLLLLNMAAGFALLAWFVFAGWEPAQQRNWAPGFAVVGTIALVFGSAMTLTWPLPGPYNIAFGETSVLLGALFLGAALALSLGWSLMSLAVYAFFAGLAAVVLGIRIIDLHLTQAPLITGVGFILPGLGGIFAAPMVAGLWKNRWLRALAGLTLAGAAALWTFTAVMAYWGHLASFGNWLPPTMR